MPGGAARVGVGLRALGRDGREVEQVAGSLRHEADASSPVIDAGPMRPRARALQRPEQRRLARAVAAHERDDLAGVQVEVDVADRDGRAVRRR